ncbi:hypothetical protein COW53_07120 [bacterium CG17_big_fil_post_rev_8_21_14_2_50_64_8]|nr:MAG: hypothetical protein COW53_07120 [bacterium CG17_big_fil_post_rev_8_21_14_2_50_64_8]PJA73197.1 MAG: hypothetical protein CO151_14505 [bacterium CG_4_9_14_3_um_filter_65_15]
MYRDFEDLRDNCPVRITANIAIDLVHEDLKRLNAVWPVTGDGEFRLYLNGEVAGFWEEAVRATGGKAIPEDGFAIDIEVDSFHDPEMGFSLYLDLHAYCGDEKVGEICWNVFDDDAREKVFIEHARRKTLELLGEKTDITGLHCEVEVTEVEEA